MSLTKEDVPRLLESLTHIFRMLPPMIKQIEEVIDERDFYRDTAEQYAKQADGFTAQIQNLRDDREQLLERIADMSVINAKLEHSLNTMSQAIRNSGEVSRSIADLHSHVNGGLIAVDRRQPQEMPPNEMENVDPP